jgi:hypothetical protein
LHNTPSLIYTGTRMLKVLKELFDTSPSLLVPVAQSRAGGAQAGHGSAAG